MLQCSGNKKAREIRAFYCLVELRGFEPPTSCAPNCATAPKKNESREIPALTRFSYPRPLDLSREKIAGSAMLNSLEHRATLAYNVAGNHSPDPESTRLLREVLGA
jgi:hypothetical protein